MGEKTGLATKPGSSKKSPKALLLRSEAAVLPGPVSYKSESWKLALFYSRQKARAPSEVDILTWLLVIDRLDINLLQVMPGSSADSAGILPDDVIIQCGGKAVQSFLEFFEIMWDKSGDPVELVVIRASADNPLCLTMVAVERTPDKFYR
ncbi:hypothetical protein Taro_039017 [Colocasia esculenta]|uniref:PDZ domain-containing protein n=1 Tax=Colocasia esculenta TaxID=4460 RepID=A0A843WNX2_COLES|nr:hypothetical protein [Colocasia esculenta]